MHLLDQRTLGIAILLLLAVLVIVKQVATGPVLDKPKGNLLVQLVNAFRLACFPVLKLSIVCPSRQTPLALAICWYEATYL